MNLSNSRTLKATSVRFGVIKPKAGSPRRLTRKSSINFRAGGRVFHEVLMGATSPDDLLRILGQYIQFNSGFAAGVASLAGHIACRWDLFRDSHEAIPALSDRSIQVASYIFFAGKEEFGNPTAPRAATHRFLAQSTLKTAARFWGRDSAALNDLLRPSRIVTNALKQVLRGYGISRRKDESTIFRAIGFHLNSERLAEDEFRALDCFLTKNHPDLVKYLKTIKTGGKSRSPAYLWIGSHAEVEAEHSQSALMCVNTALSYYAGANSSKCVKKWILEGFTEFAALQLKVMTHLS